MSRSEVLQASVEIFYENPQNSEVLCDILEKKSGISLRNLEWFITNYSKQKNLSFVTSTGKRFTVHCSYKSTLDGYSKKLFDPFCRAEKIQFKVPNTEKNIMTTVAQLNFIRWCIKNSIIDYLKEHKETLKRGS